MGAKKVLNLIKDNDVKYVDFRFTDTRGKEQHVTVPASTIEEELFEEGKMFDGSSIAGWKGINESDMILMPDADSAVLDPFTDESTLNLRCDILEPSTMEGYERDPRSVAKRAEAYLASTGIADAAYFGPEPEFFVLDDVRWSIDMSGCMVKIASQEAEWNSERVYEDGNIGHRPGVKGGYFPVPPVDSLHDLRGAMCDAMVEMGVPVEVHHHEVATAGQCFRPWSSAPTGCRSRSTAPGMSRMPMGRPSPSCRSQSSATMAQVCTCTNRCSRTATTPLLVINMVVFQR